MILTAFPHPEIWTKQELKAIRDVAKRACEVAAQDHVVFEVADLELTLFICHSRACPLDFAKMLAAPEFDFMHDVLEIIRHLDMKTATVPGWFAPRCAMNETEATAFKAEHKRRRDTLMARLTSNQRALAGGKV